jgi:methyltransferase (TIGR00027 family)
MMSAVCRGVHRLAHPRPWVLDDPYALRLVGPDWREVHAVMAGVFRPPVLDQATAAMVTRARYAEDRLRAGGFVQYVILGAGLDSLAWRRAAGSPPVRVVEVDHPATQAWKRERLAALGLPEPDGLVLAAVDFETATLGEGLHAAGFDRSVPTLFSWLGVVQYLTGDAVRATLRTVAGCAAGSEVVLTYIPTAEHLDPLGREFIEVVAEVAAGRGEPVQALLSPAEAEAMVTGCGLRVVEHLSRDDLRARYFAGRDDGFAPPTTQRVLTAAVPG